MKKKNVILMSSAFILGASLLGINAWQNEKQKEVPAETNEKTENPGEVTYTDGKTEVPKAEDKASVYIVGEHSFEKNDFTNFQSLSWDSKINGKERFILIDNNDEITAEKQKIIQSWIEKKKVVIFYGNDVKPEEVKEKIGLDFEAVDVESSASFDFPYLLYGFGFAETYEQMIPIFLASNTNKNFNEKIMSFLFKNKDF